MDKVTATICTRNRYNTTLPLCISAVAMQIYRPMELIIYDDSTDKMDMRKIPHYDALLNLLHRRGIEWKVEFTGGIGQVSGHRRAIADSKGDFIWRVDDDDIPDSNCLGSLMGYMREGVGAVGGLVLDPKNTSMSTIASNSMEDIYLGLNKQWFVHSCDSYEVDHLYSTFVYRRVAARADYYANLSRIGHREETIFTYSMKRAGWKLLINPAAVTWHLRQPEGGIRDGKGELWASDERVFQCKLEEWGVTPKKWKMIVLDNGLGDHYVFRKILPEVLARNSDIVLGCCWGDVFRDLGIKTISIAEAKMISNIDGCNLYRFMIERNWKGTLEDAYRKMYLE